MKLAIFALALTAMPLAATNPTSSCAGNLVLGVDHSNSISVKQLAAWRPMAQKRVDTLCPGDHIRAFLIDADTLTNVPLIDEAVPTSPVNPTLDELIGFRKQLASYRADLAAAFDKAFSGPTNAPATDIFSLWDRAGIGGQRTEFLLFTDGLQSHGDLNLERIRLSPDAFPGIIHHLTAFHRWDSQRLEGASVRVVLPSTDVNGPSPKTNDQRQLHHFYGVLVGSLGGQLSLFDSYIH